MDYVLYNCKINQYLKYFLIFYQDGLAVTCCLSAVSYLDLRYVLEHMTVFSNVYYNLITT